MTKKHFEERNGPKSTVSKVVKGTSPSKIRGKFFKIKVYIGIAISLLVVAILASLFLFSPNAKKESNEAISSVAKKENTSKEAIDTSKASENEKKKEEEIQKLKEQLTSLDSKVSESEKVVSKLKEETAVPKLDIEALRNNDLSSLKGTWRTPSGNEYVINESGEIYITSFRDGQKFEYTVELDNSYSHLKNRSSDSNFKEVESLSAHTKGSVAGGFVVVAVPSGVVMQPGDDGKLTDKSNHDEERLFAGQQYEAMLSRPEDVYYRVKPDTSKLEEEEKNLAQLQAEREAIKTSLESKEKKNNN
ncbi:DUF6287 domain-containing protein [Streptococcus mitis]|jgi:hypothetical protein|uniref:DUF6287 domain-containing protein n=1 Tax=Streptococcus mitis TaxID=28037 RepID=A0A428HCH6_STRMT|nr:DUF6287 domain-containing protein [Streptococcus mitis]QQQ34882.1 hypothetical protein JJN14_07445 [Streptococcus mitis]RSJ93697.1 hypothetical protein D8788_02865 [Streptococcus mitis]RSJ95620.1 hypothetical protein D8786_07600 [Streptococcus mitis]